MGAASARYFQIHDGADTNRRLMLYASAPSSLILRHDNATDVVQCVMTATHNIGERVRLLAQVYSDGAVQLHYKVGNGSTVSGTKSAALTFDPTWAGSPNTRLYVGNRQGDAHGPHWLLKRIGIPRIVTMDEAIAA